MTQVLGLDLYDQEAYYKKVNDLLNRAFVLQQLVTNKFFYEVENQTLQPYLNEIHQELIQEKHTCRAEANRLIEEIGKRYVYTDLDLWYESTKKD